MATRWAGVAIIVTGLAGATRRGRGWLAASLVVSAISTVVLIVAAVHFFGVMHRDPAAAFFLQDEFVAALVASASAFALGVWSLSFHQPLS